MIDQRLAGHLPKLRPVSLPSSLNLYHPLALVFSTSLPVSVCGTDIYRPVCDAFLGGRNHQDSPCRSAEFYSRLDLALYQNKSGTGHDALTDLPMRTTLPFKRSRRNASIIPPRYASAEYSLKIAREYQPVVHPSEP